MYFTGPVVAPAIDGMFAFSGDSVAVPFGSRLSRNVEVMTLDAFCASSGQHMAGG